MGNAPHVRLRLSRLVPWGLASLLLALATGCASDAPQDVFKPEGPQSETINNLQVPVFIAAGVVGVLVLGGLLVVLVKYRARRTDDDDTLPPQTHGHLGLELGWTILPALILAFVAVGTVVTIFDLAEEPDEALEIDVYGQQWWWAYEYDTNGDGESEVITANEMVIPVGTPVQLDIRSRDVIHSFWVPALNGKKDAVPGRTHHLTIEADEPGVFLGQCTEYCGLSHGNMRNRVIALSDDDYEAWLENQQQDAEEPSDPQAQAGLELFQAQCTSCHQINGVDEVEVAAVVSGSAPNLTHLMTRSTFAGAILDLYEEAGERDPDLGGVAYNDLPEDGSFDRNNLEAWLRNPSAEKPMSPDPVGGEGVGRGMPNLGLSEQQIDQLVAYLSTLK